MTCRYRFQSVLFCDSYNKDICLNTPPSDISDLHVQSSCPEFPVYSRKGNMGADDAADFRFLNLNIGHPFPVQTALEKKRYLTQIIPVIWLQCSISCIGITREAGTYMMSVRETGKQDVILPPNSTPWVSILLWKQWFIYPWFFCLKWSY